jgi:glycine oxidase
VKIGIIGAGIMGRLIAIELLKKNYLISLFEKDDILSSHSCAATAAGMLAPWSEATESTDLVFELGLYSLDLWPEILNSINSSDLFMRNGTAHLALYREKYKLDNALSRLKMRNININYKEINDLNKEQLIGNYSENYSAGYYLPNEASIDPRAFLERSNLFFKKNNLNFFANTKVNHFSKNKISTNEGNYEFDIVINTTGMGCKKEFKANLNLLRGVRGSLLLVEAPLVNIHSIIRLMHLRYPVYIVPRGNHKYIIGATSHESECIKPMTVESLLELLSVATHFDKGFLEAHILEQRVNLRPTFENGSPQIHKINDVYYINGLYRNGITISPAIANIFCKYLDDFKFKNTNNNIDKYLLEKLWIN